MRAIIPAAGVGERLRPLTLTKPKVLLPVAGKPIIGHIYDRIILSGIRDVTVIVGYRAQQVIDYSTSNFNLNFRFVHQTERRGLGHAVGLGLENSDEPALILLGDTILDLNFADFAKNKENVIGVMKVDDPRRFGMVELKDGWITRLVEKPRKFDGDLAIAGIYLIQNQSKLKKAVDLIIAKNITTKGEYQLTDALQVMLSQGEKIKTEMIAACHDCGTREALLEANRNLLANLEPSGKQYPDTTLIQPVFIHPDAVVRESIVGPYVSVGADAELIRSVVANSIISEKAILEDVNLNNSLIGVNAEAKGISGVFDLGDFSRQNLS
ncbi:MAG: sugar phosphate nucleotidyltransferase [Candidatus Neomarinimicrobiota bacterium]